VPLHLRIGDQQHPGVGPDSLGDEQFCQAGQAAGPCPLYAGQQVSAQGWCSAYVKKAG
jgi:hypothetical protein